MKAAIKILMLAPLVAMMGCTPSAEEMLVGRWKVTRVVEHVTVVGTSQTSERELPGYGTQVVEFLEGDVCRMADRGDTVYYHWSLDGETTLALWREGWAEDYTIEKLTKDCLIYSDTYTYYDSITGLRSEYYHTFEHNKL